MSSLWKQVPAEMNTRGPNSLNPWVLRFGKAGMMILYTFSGKWLCNPEEERDTYKNNEVDQNNKLYTFARIRNV